MANKTTDTQLVEIILSGETFKVWGDRLSIKAGTLQKRVEKFKRENPNYKSNGEVGFTIENPPNDDLADGMTAEEIIEAQQKQYRHKKELAKPSKVKINDNLPIGIIHMGDPHIDDGGCNWELLKKHIELSHRDGIAAGNVGDTTNSWVGYLQRLYANQVVTESQAWKLTEYFVKETNWLYILLGNHDLWNGSSGSNPLDYIISKNIVKKDWGGLIELTFPNEEKFIINAKHSFPGRSQYNNAFGQVKQIFRGGSADIYIAGHTHCWGYTLMENEISKKTAHGIQVKGYKEFDDHALNLGYEDQESGHACMTILNPYAKDNASRIQVFFGDLEVAADYLEWLRNRYRKSSKLTNNKRGK